MFTGIIETVGHIASVRRSGDAARIVVLARWTDGQRPGVALGDSVAVNGVCLTVVDHPTQGDAVALAFDVSHETLARSSLGSLAAGSKVNLERALRLGDRLGGHWVSGHVDAMGQLVAADRRSDAWDLRYSVPAALEPEIVTKGSIAIDGVSLTVNSVWPGGFGVTIIPHTSEHTELLDGGVGKAVNLETDILAKHIRRLASFGLAATGGRGVDADLLRRAGFDSP